MSISKEDSFVLNMDRLLKIYCKHMSYMSHLLAGTEKVPPEYIFGKWEIEWF